MAAPLTRCGCHAMIKNRFASLSRALVVSHVRPQLSQLQEESSKVKGSNKIVLPKKKTREATTVLRALAATLPKDYDAPNYVYTDDPFLIPTSAVDKRSFSLAKASGMRAANWVMDQLPEKFTKNPAEPSIEAFMPSFPPRHPENEVEGLIERIERNEPLVAFNSYQAVKQSGSQISSSTIEDLIGLLAFYNSEDPPEELVEEEQFYKGDLANKKTRVMKKTWKTQGPAEQVFEEMPDKTPRAYLELLKGRAKYLDADGTWEVFQEMKKRNIPVTDEVYRTVLSVSNFMSETSQGRWDFMQEVLRDMSDNGIVPSLLTFNTVLSCIARNSRFRDSNKWIMQVIKEMKDSNVEPSLASYAYILKTVYSNEEVTSNILNEIVDYLHGKEMVPQEPADYDFFATAMPKCYNNVKDLELTYKIDDLLNTGNNFLLLGDGFKQGLYYTYFLKTMCMFEQIDKIMENYERITPHMYTPTFSAYDDLMRAIELNEGYDYLPQIWSDMVLFDYTKRSDLIAALLQIMGKRKQSPELQEIYVRITGFIREKFEEEKLVRRLNPFQLNGDMIGNIMMINLHGDNYDTAWDFFQLYKENKLSVEKFPSEQSLITIAEASIEHGKADNTLEIIQLMTDCAYPKVDEVAAKATKSLTLSEEQMNFIDDLL